MACQEDNDIIRSRW